MGAREGNTPVYASPPPSRLLELRDRSPPARSRFRIPGRSGERIEDEEILERIRGLVIPPAWEDVWICPHPFGHIQAVGHGEGGRLLSREHAGGLPSLLHRPAGLRPLPRRRCDRR